MPLLQTNAELIAVEATPEDDYDGSASAGTKWTGEEDVYLDARTVRVPTQGSSELDRRWTVYTRVELAELFNVGDNITLRTRLRTSQLSTVTVPIQSIDVRDDPEIPEEVCSVALVVEPAAP